LIKAITFDLWNTLIKVADYQAERLQFLQDVLIQNGFNFEKHQIHAQYKKAFNFSANYSSESNNRHITAESRVREIITGLNINLPEGEINKIITFFENVLLENPPRLKPYVQEILSKLALKYPLGMISDTGITPGAALRKMLEKYGILKYFTVTTFSDETGYFKPHPFNFEQTLQNLNIQSNEYASVVHVGDIIHTDIAGAKGIGMKGIWVKSMKYYLEGSKEEFQPDATIENLDELPSLLEQI
jgi:putative hydrolase of the HAD superfamily